MAPTLAGTPLETSRRWLMAPLIHAQLLLWLAWVAFAAFAFWAIHNIHVSAA